MNTATQKQIDLINRLKNERDLEVPWSIGEDIQTDGGRSHIAREALGASRRDWKAGQFTKACASLVIEALFAAPKKPEKGQEAGVYEADGHMYRVYLGQTSGQMLVKAIEVDEGVTYTYLGTAARCLPADARRLSLEEVGSLGKKFDHCLCCGRRLDDPESVDRGIGPVCARKYEAA